MFSNLLTSPININPFILLDSAELVFVNECELLLKLGRTVGECRCGTSRVLSMVIYFVVVSKIEIKNISILYLSIIMIN